MFTFLLESVCFDSINRIEIVFMKKKTAGQTTRSRGKNVICLNGKFLTIPTVRKALNSFCSKTRNISEIIICDKLLPGQRTIKSLLKILLKNGKKNNWKLKYLDFDIKRHDFLEIDQLMQLQQQICCIRGSCTYAAQITSKTSC